MTPGVLSHEFALRSAKINSAACSAVMEIIGILLINKDNSSQQQLKITHKITFAHCQPIVPQNRIDGSHMEEKLRQAIII